MGAWIKASLFIATVLWLKSEAHPQLFENQYQQHIGLLASQPQVGYYYLPSGIQLQSAATGETQNKYTSVDLPPSTKSTTNDQGNANGKFDKNALESAFPIYTKFEQNFAKDFDDFVEKRTTDVENLDVKDLEEKSNSSHAASDRNDGAVAVKPYDDHSTSQSSYHIGPHQVETIDSEHFHKKVPAYDVSNFQHQHGEKHGEVHYHQHTHVHQHQHKQEHVHDHKQSHQHKHLHNQQHKHEHHSAHKHGHDHKHDHHQDHKHEHHHDHKQEAHHDHKHQHNHGHKHDARHHHHSQHKHHHGHKHQAKHEHKHKHNTHYSKH